MDWADELAASVDGPQVVNDSKTPSGTVHVGSLRGPVILDAIKDGFATGTMAQNPYGQAFLATYSLKLLADGCTYKGTDFYIDTGLLFINKDNLATQADELSAVTKGLAGTWKDTYFACP